MTSSKRLWRSAPLICCILACPLAAQQTSEEHRNNVAYIGGGAAIPGGDLRSYMSTAGLLHVGYGYRFLKYFQADVSLIAAFGSAGISRSVPTSTGDVHIHDSEYLVPLGARAVLPLISGRLEFFGGGGPVFMHYAEESEGKTVPCTSLEGFPSTCTIDQICPHCTSRGGWGGYGIGGTRFALDRRHRGWIEAETLFMRGTTSGKLLGSGASFQTKDQWLNAAMTLGYRF